MNTLRENPNTSNMLTTSSPKAGSDDQPKQVPKTPLKKEDLEKIAKQLKHKLSKASITAKQSMSPIQSKSLQPVAASAHSSKPLKGSSMSPSRNSPLKYMIRKLNSNGNLLFGSSPNGKSPTQMKTPAAVFLSSSPLKNSTTMHDGDELDSPTKHGVTFGSSPIAFRDREEVEEEKMTLQPIAPNSHIYPPSTPPRSFATVLRPSPALQTTPGKKSLSVNTQSNVVAVNPLLRTPTQPSVAALHAAASGNAMVGGNGPQTDNEGADLLMYLATSPSPAKAAPTISFLGATPRSNQQTNSNSSKSNNTTTSTITNATNNNFIAPAPPLTPKRPIITTARTPQNRLTPLVNLNSATGGGAGVGGGVGGGGGGGVNGNGGPPGATGGAGGGGLPSSGLMLTPAGFNMSDYFNFFTPLPGGGSLGHNLSNKFLKTPDLHNHLLSQGNSSLNQVARQKVDGKMINFDKVGLFGGNDQQKEQ